MAIYQPPPRFRVGQVVRYRKTGSRGVVIRVDSSYRGDDTVPRLEQALTAIVGGHWYQVLLDGAHYGSYLSESALDRLDSTSPIQHPLLSHYFSGFENGLYSRWVN